ncbi:hypothetical protein LINPERPRIM_LOCUS32664 [Linum perenne]
MAPAAAPCSRSVSFIFLFLSFFLLLLIVFLLHGCVLLLQWSSLFPLWAFPSPLWSFCFRSDFQILTGRFFEECPSFPAFFLLLRRVSGGLVGLAAVLQRMTAAGCFFVGGVF